MFAGAALAGLSAKASAQYTLTTDVAVPFYSGDGVTGSTTANSASSASAFVDYTSLTLSNLFPISSVPNGTYTSPLLGTTSGTLVANSAVSEATGWAYDPTHGFRLIGYYSENSAGSHSAPTLKNANSLGVIGDSPRASAFNTSTSLMGQDAWFYNSASGTNTTLGLTGAGFGYTYQNSIGQVFGTSQFSTPYYLNSGGQVTGTSARYAGVAGTGGGGNLGTSVWIQSPAGTPTEIGLTGLGYNYFVSSTVSGYNSSGGYTSTAPYSGTTYTEGVSGQDSSGDVIGSATAYYNTGLGGTAQASINSSNGSVTGAYTALGQDGWFYNHANGVTTPVGLYWSQLAPSIAGSQFASLNTQLAYSNIPAASKPVGTSPSNSTYRTTSVYGISSSGQVVGTSGYFNTSSTATNPLGTDAFVYSPTTGIYTTIGLVSNSFTTIGYPQAVGQTSFVNPFGARSSTVSAMNDNNQIAGTSAVYVGVGTGQTYVNQGQAAWIANATTGATTQIGLWNQSTGIHVSNSTSAGIGVYSDAITSMTESGFVAGYSSRYNASNGSSFGTDSWVYDASKNMTFPVDPTDEANGSAYTVSSIFYLSEGGVAVGDYKVGSSSAPFNAFIWSEAGGFDNLGNEVVSGLSSSGYQSLIQGYYSDQYGSNIYATASLPGSPTITSAVVTLTGTAPVPEPASVALLAAGSAVGLLRRRRRIVSAM
jgi:hypothetical protein